MKDGLYNCNSNEYIWRTPCRELHGLGTVPYTELRDGNLVDLSPHVYPPDEGQEDDENLHAPSRYLIWLHSLVAKVYLTVLPKQMCAENFEDPYYQYIDWDDEYWQGPPGSVGYLESDDERD